MTESRMGLWIDARRAVREGAEGIARRQRARLADHVGYARAYSPYFREAYRDLPERVEDPTLLPVTSKKALMDRFDDWVTDRAVTLEKVQAFVDDPEMIGRRFLGRYLVGTTSGASGYRGLFIQDDREGAVQTVLSTRDFLPWLGFGDVLRLLTRGMRTAQLVATGGHYIGYAGYKRLTMDSRWRRKTLRSLSVHMPLPELVGILQEFRPAVIVGYASMIKVLADEQAAGRLHIDPVIVGPAGETITSGDVQRIASAFHTKVRASYAATECTYLSFSCQHGWYHVNSDWVIAEPVDAEYRATPPGEWSHTVLISDLANRVQPILRYDLGDRVMVKPDPCPCGSPLPTLRVEGRSGDTLIMLTARGERRVLTPLALATLFDRTPGIELFQIVQTKPDTLRVRLRPTGDADPELVWRTVHNELTRVLTDNDLGNVTIEHAEEPPQRAPGGKYRAVVPLPG
ncbi:phenylacetate--CoA ligase family protein [Nocardia iowensis]|uniref:Phenylacetate--CoA ligase family protein n=1 Tax=Nocardia iowensis TaxID=204891 RepID=A0ABX8S1M6_NOCIO|nr:phenylacetate--CoA ligase family protein [Nocardia iowensis]QXN95112.1 phenylacetate--CoA ligase family protein [Nocardia iowensis]